EAPVSVPGGAEHRPPGPRRNVGRVAAGCPCRRRRRRRHRLRSPMARAVLIGQAGSPGIGGGRLLWVDGGSNGTGHGARPPGSRSVERDDPDAVAGQERRLLEALEGAATELETLAEDTAGRAGPEVGAIFEAQAMF